MRKNEGRARLTDVAQMAGCAAVTVSRYFNDPGRVSAEVKRAIEDAISQLGYYRNESARVLRSNRSKLVGVVIPTLRHAIYADMVEGLQRQLAMHGFSLIHNVSDYDLDEEYAQARNLVERGVEALVLVGTRHRKKTMDMIKASNVTGVITYALRDDFNVASVGFDNSRAAAMAAETLLALGHKRFGMIAGITLNNDRAQSRVEGFSAALAQAGIPAANLVVREARYDIREGGSAMAELLDIAPDVTAVFCGSDVLAVGALRECKKRGLGVPADISIIGFDNLEISELSDPPLSTLNVPAVAMGQEAANYIIQAKPGEAPAKKVELEVVFVPRGTTARAKSSTDASPTAADARADRNKGSEA
jgi:LacI family transcriptional regulator